MAGKGRGRGSNFTFDLQAIGFSRGDALPETQAQPMPLYPHIDFKPSSLLEGEEQSYLLALKQELRGNMKCLPYYMGNTNKKLSIDKYSTKYVREAEKKRTDVWTPDWQLLPREMKAVKKMKKKGEKKAKAAKPGTNVDVLKKIEVVCLGFLGLKAIIFSRSWWNFHAGTTLSASSGDSSPTYTHIQELEKKGDNEKSDEENEEKKKEEDDEEEAEVEMDDEENEEENDYIASYFEDGDDFGNSDDNMDEATY
ncbi:DNA-directed RNA polymerase III subunit RPC7 isoform X1 [Dendrobates tinctorius]|uniref:DNA-directed RNA polymerase III subunit RPC7 isoform X1 n=1 Tax=Dendrobates tinctorius TaxID=92724 RepID=UPI003CC9ECFF